MRGPKVGKHGSGQRASNDTQMQLDTSAIARLNKIIAEARDAILKIRGAKSPAQHFERIKDLAEGYPS